MSVMLPLFPLQLVAFPGETLKLHIFEPRYLQLIGECRDEGIAFGIPPYADGVMEYGTEVVLHTIVAAHPSGEMDILVEGRRVFHLDTFQRFFPGKSYPGGSVTWLDNDASCAADTVRELVDCYNRFHALLKTGHEREAFDGPHLSFQVAHEIGMTLEQKVRLLAISHEEERQRLVIAHLRQAAALLQAAEETQRHVRKNGHFKRFPPLDI